MFHPTFVRDKPKHFHFQGLARGYMAELGSLNRGSAAGLAILQSESKRSYGLEGSRRGQRRCKRYQLDWAICYRVLGA
jgi:hypothetical protein